MDFGALATIKMQRSEAIGLLLDRVNKALGCEEAYGVSVFKMGFFFDVLITEENYDEEYHGI